MSREPENQIPNAAHHFPSLQPIGVVHSCFGEKFAIPRQPGLCPSAWGTLTFHEPYRSPEAIRGLEGFSHIWLIFSFHQTAAQGWHPTVRPPRLGGNQRIGVFASRSTFRPNNLGLSLVRLEKIELSPQIGPILHLGGLDLVDGTPVYDIKPYLPYAESIPDATTGFATEEIPRLSVEISAAARPAFSQLSPRAQSLIQETLSLDPRPAVQKANDPARIFGAILCGKNIRFSIEASICRILALEEPGE